MKNMANIDLNMMNQEQREDFLKALVLQLKKFKSKSGSEGTAYFVNDKFVVKEYVKQTGIHTKNFNIDSKSIRNEETTFTSDIIINASNVTINGIEMIDKAKFTFDDLESSVENIKFEYCKITNSTVNDNNARDIAVFNLVSNNNYIIRNITIDNCYIEKTTTSRSMIIYAVDVDGLTVKNSCFYGTANKGSFNDGIKVDNQENGKSQFGIKGNVIIENNIFKNYNPNIKIGSKNIFKIPPVVSPIIAKEALPS